MSVKITETNLKFKNNLTKRTSTKKIVLHHADAIKADAATIHEWHLKRGWAGIGYHFVVRKTGVIERGRPIDTVGAHCEGQNSDSVGVCFEGNYQTEKEMPSKQLESGQKLISYLKEKYSGVKIYRHGDLMATACPGKNFPFDKIAAGYDDTNASITAKCNLYKTHNDWSGVLHSVAKGARIKHIQDHKYGWSEVEYDGQKGYIKNTCIQMDNGTSLCTYPVRKTTSDVYLRSERKVSEDNHIASLKKGEQFTLLGKGDKWVYAQYKGKKGYLVKSKTNVE